MWEAIVWPLVVVLVIAVLFGLTMFLVRIASHEREDEWPYETASDGDATLTPGTPTPQA
jgi:hypothetical protein